MCVGLADALVCGEALVVSCLCRRCGPGTTPPRCLRTSLKFSFVLLSRAGVVVCSVAVGSVVFKTLLVLGSLEMLVKEG